MLRVKVFSVRQAINNLLYITILFLVIIFISFILLSSLYVFKNEFEKNFIKDIKFSISDSFTNKSIINNLINDEYLLFRKEDFIVAETKIDVETWNIEDTNNLYFITQEYSEIDNKNERNVDIDYLLKYNLPQSFKVEKMSNGDIIVGNTRIKNYSKSKIDLNELSKPAIIQLDNDTSFLVFHTHTTESYTVPGASDVVNYRTMNEEHNVVAVGKELKNCLDQFGFYSIHNTKLHDYPNYNGSYGASLETVQECFKQKNYDFVIDIHRDALSSNYNFRPTVEINGERAAKIMFVIGTNGSGLEHDNWINNLKNAILIQNRAEEMYPGLFRDLTLSNYRYNQHVSDGAFIIEVGATGNTLEEVKTSMKYLSNVFASFKN